MHKERHVVAVAGGGKTTFLIKEVKEAMANTTPDKVIVVTYTRNMAKELKDKLGSKYRLLYCGTMHHILYQMLTEKYPERFLSIVNEVENEDIVKELCAKIKLKHTKETLNRVLTEKYWKISKLESSFKKLYIDYFTKYRIISYPLIEMYGAELINDKEWDYLFVDEYQDMSLDNIKVINGINSKNKLFVYDPMQSIYGFRGARPDLLPKSDEILGRSYRCPSAITDLANHILTFAGDQYPVIMEPNVEGGEVIIHHVENHQDHYDGLREIVEGLLQRYRPGEIAILGRTNNQLEQAQEKLIGLPYQRVSSHVLSSREMMAFKYLLRIMIIEDDYNVIKFARATKLITTDGAALSSYVDPVTMAKSSSSQSALSIRKMPLYINYRLAMEKQSIDGAARFMMESMGGRDWIIDECINIISWLGLYYGKDYEKIENALSEMDTDATIGKDDKIRLMTVHTAKGLEYKAIVIINVYNGTFPHHNANPMEELRLFYVAITRARESVTIMQCGKHSWLDNYYQPMINIEEQQP